MCSLKLTGCDGECVWVCMSVESMALTFYCSIHSSWTGRNNGRKKAPIRDCRIKDMNTSIILLTHSNHVFTK